MIARGLYLLNERREVVPARSFTEWALAFHHCERTVALTDLELCEVSTVFLGIDHRFLGGGPPIVFETMVFPAPEIGDAEGFATVRRYCTWGEAEVGHMDIVERITDRIAQLKADAQFVTAAALLGAARKE